MQTTYRTRFLLLLPLFVAVALFVTAAPPEAEEVVTEDAVEVSEADLKTFLEVYQAMQADHGMKIEEATERCCGVTVDAFRQIERRVQGQPRMVERARGALLEFAKSHSAVQFGASAGTSGKMAEAGDSTTAVP